jgi:hypothetical protein
MLSLYFENAVPNHAPTADSNRRRIYAVAFGVTQAQAIGAGERRRRWIWIAAEVDPDNIALTRNYMTINDAQHGTLLAYY